MRENIQKCTSRCAHCASHNMWRNRKNEIYFSWPVTVPFWIMHVNFWYSGHIVTKNTGVKCYLMNFICDLTQFVISSIDFDITSTNLSHIFHVQSPTQVWNVLSSSHWLWQYFQIFLHKKFKALKLTYLVLYKKTHGKQLGKMMSFSQQNIDNPWKLQRNPRCSNKNAKKSQYTWNSTPIDGTHIFQSVAAVRR